MRNKFEFIILACCAAALPACMATAPIHPEARLHNNAGATLLQAGNLDKAEDCLRLSLEYNPCHADALHNLAVACILRGDLERAERHELEALECRPDLVQAVNGLAVVYRSRGELPRAAELFARAVRMDPGYLDARRNLILTYIDMGDTKRARKQLRRLAILAPEDPLLRQARDTMTRISSGE